MFVSTASGRRLTPGIAASADAERSCPAVVVRDAVEHRVQGDEPRRRSDAGAVDARAAEAVQHRPGPTDDRVAPGEHRAERRREALVERHHDGVRGRGEVGERDTERDGCVHQPGAVDVDTAVVPLGRGGERPGQLRRQRRPTGPRVRVLEDEQGGAVLGRSSSSTAAGSIRPSGAQSGDGSSRAISTIPIASDVRT